MTKQDKAGLQALEVGTVVVLHGKTTVSTILQLHQCSGSVARGLAVAVDAVVSAQAMDIAAELRLYAGWRMATDTECVRLWSARVRKQRWLAFQTLRAIAPHPHVFGAVSAECRRLQCVAVDLPESDAARATLVMIEEAAVCLARLVELTAKLGGTSCE